MAADGKGVRGASKDDEGADEIGEGGVRAKSDGTESGGHDAGKDGGFNGARELEVDVGEGAGEGDGVVTCESPPGAADGEEGAD